MTPTERSEGDNKVSTEREKANLSKSTAKGCTEVKTEREKANLSKSTAKIKKNSVTKEIGVANTTFQGIAGTNDKIVIII